MKVLYRTSARFQSSCSKALAIRLISEARAPTAFAVSRQVAVTVATSLTTDRACGSVSAKNPETASRRSYELQNQPSRDDPACRFRWTRLGNSALAKACPTLSLLISAISPQSVEQAERLQDTSVDTDTDIGVAGFDPLKRGTGRESSLRHNRHGQPSASTGIMQVGSKFAQSSPSGGGRIVRSRHVTPLHCIFVKYVARSSQILKP